MIILDESTTNTAGKQELKDFLSAKTGARPDRVTQGNSGQPEKETEGGPEQNTLLSKKIAADNPIPTAAVNPNAYLTGDTPTIDEGQRPLFINHPELDSVEVLQMLDPTYNNMPSPSMNPNSSDINLEDSGVAADPAMAAFVHPETYTTNPSNFTESFKNKGQVNDFIVAMTHKYSDRVYSFGSKSLNNKGIDCSGWVAESTLGAMKQVNKIAPGTYDINKMSRLMQQGAAWQIKGIADVTGRLIPDDDVRTGQLNNGTLIGIRRPSVPGWAKNRPMGISHVVQVVEQAGQKFISQSGGSTSGVGLVDFKAFMRSNSGSTFYAVDPFRIR